MRGHRAWVLVAAAAALTATLCLSIGRRQGETIRVLAPADRPASGAPAFANPPAPAPDAGGGGAAGGDLPAARMPDAG